MQRGGKDVIVKLLKSFRNRNQIFSAVWLFPVPWLRSHKWTCLILFVLFLVLKVTAGFENSKHKLNEYSQSQRQVSELLDFAS